MVLKTVHISKHFVTAHRSSKCAQFRSASRIVYSKIFQNSFLLIERIIIHRKEFIFTALLEQIIRAFTHHFDLTLNDNIHA